MSIYNNRFEEQLDKINSLSDIVQMTNNATQLHLEDSKLQDFSQDSINEIVKEICNLYNEETLKGKNFRSALDTIEQFLINKKQNPVNIINICLDVQINSTVQIIIGTCYIYGKWVEKDNHKALIYFQKAAEMGDAFGIYMVGFCYFNRIGVAKDKHKAFIYYQKSAEMGYDKGTYMAGYCHRYGIGVKKDVHKAFAYYQKSADMGNVYGIREAGNCYLYGIGIEKDEYKAYIYYQKSAEMIKE